MMEPQQISVYTGFTEGDSAIHKHTFVHYSVLYFSNSAVSESNESIAWFHFHF